VLYNGCTGVHGETRFLMSADVKKVVTWAVVAFVAPHN
jgi:hypothetical protein